MKYAIAFLVMFTQMVSAQVEKKLLSGVINCNESQNVHLIFPDNIKQATTGSKYYKFSYNTNQPDKLGLLKGNPNAPGPSSLFIVTMDGNMYSFTISYDKALAKPNFFVDKKMSIGNLNDKATSNGKSNSFSSGNTNEKPVIYNLNKMSKQKSFQNNKPKVEKPNSDTNTSPTDLNLNNYTFNNSKNNSKVIKTSNSGSEESSESSEKINPDNDVDELYKWHKEEYMRKKSAYQIIGKPYYKGNSTTVMNKKIELYLMDIVYDRNELYFVIELKNKSGIDYDINFINFAVDLRKKNKKSSTQQITKEPLYVYKEATTVPRKDKLRTVIVFDKFSIADTKVFSIEVNEKKGERNLFLSVDANTINNPN